MKWTELLKSEIEAKYSTTEKLFDLVKDSELGWKPATGDNWMTLGQLLLHCTNACGFCCRGFATGDWGMPEGASDPDAAPADMLPSAEKMPTVKSVAEAKKLLAADKAVALNTVVEAGEETMLTQDAPAPWDPTPTKLGYRFLQMVDHLSTHKAQLFYYLKLQGKPVNTMHLWGV